MTSCHGTVLCLISLNDPSDRVYIWCASAHVIYEELSESTDTEAWKYYHNLRFKQILTKNSGPGSLLMHITKTCLCNVDPLKLHFYIVNWGLQGYTLLFLFLHKNIDCGYSLEPPRRGGSNEYPKLTLYVLPAEIRKISEFLSENFHFLVVKFSAYLNMHVFVMKY